MRRSIQMHVVVSGDLVETSIRSMMQRQASKLQVTGWVRFTEDGDVEAVYNGPETNVQAMVRWCERGPLGPRVTAVVANPQPREAFFGFDVRK